MSSKFLNHLRLAGFPLGLGLTSVLVSGTLNRVMIVELNIPAALVGLFFALPLLISPLRVWLGYQSDTHPIWGLRREPFIILGSLLAGVGIISAVTTLLNINALSLSILIVSSAFLAYGVGKNLSSNTFEALISDKFTGDQRPRAVTFYKVAMFIGIVSGAILLGRLLDPFSNQRLLTIVLAVAALAFILSAAAVWGQEPRKRTLLKETQHAQEQSFSKTIKSLVWQDRQIRRFFIFVMLTVIGTLAQDVLLEPYAALVLGMSVGQTTSLTAIWGAGTLLAMAVSGMWLIKRFGYTRVVQFGLVMGILIFIGLILAGFFMLTWLFWGLVFLLGLSTGLSASGMLTAVIEFTTSPRAGLLMGVWGLAHNLGQALGSLLSGAVVDLVQLLQGSVLTAYGAIFTLEAFMLLIALLTLKQVQINQARVFKENPTFRG